MNQDKLNKLFDSLIREDIAHVDLLGSLITVRVCDASTKISLSATVYQGTNYIPKSVRQCLSNERPPVKSQIRTSLALDEEQFQINLNYLGRFDHVDKKTFLSILEEFSWLAEEWRYLLDEHDRHDLIYIHAKS